MGNWLGCSKEDDPCHNFERHTVGVGPNDLSSIPNERPTTKVQEATTQNVLRHHEGKHPIQEWEQVHASLLHEKWLDPGNSDAKQIGCTRSLVIALLTTWHPKHIDCGWSKRTSSKGNLSGRRDKPTAESSELSLTLHGLMPQKAPSEN